MKCNKMDLEKLKEILKIQNWDIQVVEEKTLDVMGQCKLIYNDCQAVIRIKEELSEEEKLKSLIHEMLHIVHRDEMDIASENIENESIRNMYNRFHERSIEQMAKILYRLIKEG